MIGLDFDGRTISWAWRQCDLVHVERIGADQPTMPAPKPRDCGVPRVVSPRPRLSVRGRLVLHVVCRADAERASESATRPTPRRCRRAAPRVTVEEYRRRVTSKRIAERWPRVRIEE